MTLVAVSCVSVGCPLLSGVVEVRSESANSWSGLVKVLVNLGRNPVCVCVCARVCVGAVGRGVQCFLLVPVVSGLIDGVGSPFRTSYK